MRKGRGAAFCNIICHSGRSSELPYLVGKRYDELEDRFKKAKRRLEEAGRQRLEKKTRRDMVDAFIEDLKRQDGLIAEFDEQLWYSLVEYATVYGETDVRFTFKDGTIMQAYD